MTTNRLFTLLKRKRVAGRLGIAFDRSASFRLPKSVSLNGTPQAIHLPEEIGVKVAFIELLLDDCYGCHQLQKSGETIKTVLDIGANVGLFGLAARCAFPDATIHSYEPNAMLAPYLVVQASVAKFEYFLEAVGSEGGTVSLAMNADSVLTRAVEAASGDVPRTAFREAIRRMGGEVDFLKMDCEGAEWDIFNDRESWRQVKHLAMEYHLFENKQTEQRVKACVEGLGFHILKFQPAGNSGLLTAMRRV